jgi:hypothetical protein
MSVGMKRKIVAGFSVMIGLVAIGLLGTTVCAQEVETIKQEWMQESWRIIISLDMPDLIPPVVQYAVFDEDPTPEFEKTLRINRKLQSKFLDAAKSPAEKTMIQNAFFESNWNFVFKKVTGDQVSLLVSAAYIKEATGLYRMSSVGSNGPAGKKWIVTKIVQIKDKPICWCLPLDTEIGKDVTVVLNKQNVFDLAGVYNKAMGEGPGIK